MAVPALVGIVGRSATRNEQGWPRVAGRESSAILRYWGQKRRPEYLRGTRPSMPWKTRARIDKGMRIL
jgi:hypothetical protein